MRVAPLVGRPACGNVSGISLRTNGTRRRYCAWWRAELLGLDPSDNIDMNTFVHERAKCLLEEYKSDQMFDVISLRMVAEHIRDPESAVAALSRLTRNGGRVVIYTVSKWSPASLVADLTPMAVHHVAKKILWNGLPEDTFPTVYRMNTRKQLQRLFMAAGFVEESFHYLDDCRGFGRWRLTAMIELSAQRALRAVGLRYPDVCLLGTYRKQDVASTA
jgi:SAM-dependent methyltransferase